MTHDQECFCAGLVQDVMHISPILIALGSEQILNVIIAFWGLVLISSKPYQSFLPASSDSFSNLLRSSSLLGESKGLRELRGDLARREREALPHADVADALLPPLAHALVDGEAPLGPDVLDVVLGVNADEAVPDGHVVGAPGGQGVEAQVADRRVEVVWVLHEPLAGRGPELGGHVHLAVRLEHG